MRNFICLIILLAGLDLQAQVFLPGKLMTSEGDTLVGFVAEQGGITWSFKETKNGVVRIFTRRQVVGFQRKDERYEEHTVEVLRGKFPERVKDFLLVVEEGQVRTSQLRRRRHFWQRPYLLFFARKGHGDAPLRINVDPANFKVQIRQYFSDYPELAAKIKSKELGYEKIQEIVQLYNSWYKLQPHDDESKPVDKEPDVEKPAKEKKPKKEKVDKDEESSEE
jgi:hypothetical protein